MMHWIVYVLATQRCLVRHSSRRLSADSFPCSASFFPSDGVVVECFLCPAAVVPGPQ